MSELALQLIAEAKEKRLACLDLGNCGLTELPPELFALDWLQELRLSKEYGEWDEKQKIWKGIESQNKGEQNSLTHLPTNFSCLKSLKVLFAHGQKIIDISPLSELDELNTLFLFNNQIDDVSPLAALTGLTELYLSENQLSDVSALAALTGLTSLDLRSNELSDVSPLAALTGLTYLNLTNNHLSDVSALAALTGLTSLSLDNNKFITSLKSLISLFEKDTTIYTSGCPITEPPQEIIEQGNAAILNYFKQIKQQGGETTRLYEAKLIIVGEPGAGKTTLMEKLFDPEYKVPQDSKSTLGIVVREGWSFPLEHNPDIQFKANIWDFGGQEIQYMTHQFFLTPSALYILASDNRKQNTHYSYWFNIINLLGKEPNFPSDDCHTSVIVALNDIEHNSNSDFDVSKYKKQYEKKLGIQQRDIDLSKNDADFRALCTAIQRALTKLHHVGNQLPKQWRPIREDLRQLDKDHISFAEYQQICAKHGITEEDSQLNLSSYLHKLGSILHFQNDSHLHDFIILNPQWAVDAVYSVLVDKQVGKNKGHFTHQYLNGIWKKYNHTERNNLLNLMKADNFEICYPVGKDAYIAPQLLPSKKPDNYEWNTEDNLNFRFRYAFMPKGIVVRLIVRLHHLIKEPWVWREGVVLTEKGCELQIIENEESKVIDIAVRGHHNERKYFLRKIIDEVRDIHNTWFENIEVDEMIPCHCERCETLENPYFHQLKKLQERREQGLKTAECNESFKNISVQGLLEGVFEKEELKRVKSDKMSEMHVHTHIHNRNLNIAGNAENNNLNQGDNVKQLAQKFANLTPEQRAKLLNKIN
ncbi:COR domain-containing protein [Candidatus Albibeggiatoa sp. nov. NOAA]|uniref:COR domain-containing protein n=1 Tax=Candidatus Albibeggiatoa sp. nov. NOAA TaxID=3162724 RepID=UPI0032FFBB11|nr:leucine-rich repeat domain-containing protein [Thiotrichaceae bacterium]